MTRENDPSYTTDPGSEPEARERIQVLLPVHNEAESIEAVLAEIHAALSDRLEVEFILSEDGSSDGTPEVLRHLATRYPMIVMSDPQRKGYARAALDGLGRATSSYVLFLDSDGQYDPADFWDLYGHRDRHDIVVGWRVHRSDTPGRRLMSRVFGLVHRALFGFQIHDPSCSFVLMKLSSVRPFLSELGFTKEGFWWEFTARAMQHGLSIQEVPVRHRLRAAGKTRVYNPTAIPGIGLRNLRGLWKVWRSTRRTR